MVADTANALILCEDTCLLLLIHHLYAVRMHKPAHRCKCVWWEVRTHTLFVIGMCGYVPRSHGNTLIIETHTLEHTVRAHNSWLPYAERESCMSDTYLFNRVVVHPQHNH